MATNDESITKEIYGIIGAKLQLPGETELPFTYLSLVTNYNGVDVNQREEYIEVNASNNIDLLLTSCGWNDSVKRLTPDKPLTPMPEDSVSKIFVTTHNKIEGSAVHEDLEKKIGFSYHCLFGELMCAYVTYRPDIGYSICCLNYTLTF